MVLLTLCHQKTKNDVVALPRIVDRSCLSTFSYTMSYTCVYQLVWITYCFKLFDSLVQDVWISSYKQADWSWPFTFRTLRFHKEATHSNTLCFPSIAIMALHRNVLQEWVLVRVMCEVVSGYICNMQIYSAEEKKLEGTVLPHLDRNTGQNCHIKTFL
jgi:hypothetical protein